MASCLLLVRIDFRWLNQAIVGFDSVLIGAVGMCVFRPLTFLGDEYGRARGLAQSLGCFIRRYMPLKKSRLDNPPEPGEEFVAQKYFERTIIETCTAQFGNFAIIGQPQHKALGNIECEQRTQRGIPPIGRPQDKLVVEHEICGKVHLQRCTPNRFK